MTDNGSTSSGVALNVVLVVIGDACKFNRGGRRPDSFTTPTLTPVSSEDFFPNPTKAGLPETFPTLDDGDGDGGGGSWVPRAAAS